jgi:hypothetical protein
LLAEFDDSKQQLKRDAILYEAQRQTESTISRIMPEAGRANATALLARSIELMLDGVDPNTDTYFYTLRIQIIHRNVAICPEQKILVLDHFEPEVAASK